MAEPATAGYGMGIVHFRAPESVIALAWAATRWTAKPNLLVVADNSGEFLDPLWASRLPPNATVLDMDGNKGYAAAANAALRTVERKHLSALLLLTQDARLEADTAGLLLDALDDDRVDVSLPLLAFAERPETLFSAGGLLLPDGRTAHRGFGQPFVRGASSAEPYEVDWGDGACMMLRVPAILSLGGFDEAYFLYVEEVDLQLRVRTAGRRVVLVPNALAYQNPGSYSLYYKYRNLSYLSSKYRDRLAPFRWQRTFLADAVRVLIRDHAWFEPFWALRGVADYHRGHMRTPRPASLFAGYGDRGENRGSVSDD